MDFMNLYVKCTVKQYYFLINYTTLASNNPLCFRKNLLERIKKLILTINITRGEKLQHNIIRETAKISALSSGKIDKNS